MITAAFCQCMARYNMWQNQSLLAAADTLSDSARSQDRGAFFGSISATLSHVLWGDGIWMSRFDGWDKPKGGFAQSLRMAADWDNYKRLRVDADHRIKAWADALSDGDLDGELIWFSNSLNAELQKSKATCVAGFFNHQTHHRGQVHAMLTSAGARPDDTDLFLLPEDV